MKRPDYIPDPAFGDGDLNVAVEETVGHMANPGDAPTSMPAHVGPPADNSEDHNSDTLWNGAYGSS